MSQVQRNHTNSTAPQGTTTSAAAGVVSRDITFGVVASVVPTGIFAFIWEHVEDKGRGTTAFDRDVSYWMHAHQAPGWTDMARVLAAIGSGPTVVCIAIVAVVVGLVSRRHRGAAWTLPVAVLGAGALIQCGKVIFHRPRPQFFTPLLHATGYSFPSGHSLISVTVYGLIGYFALATTHRRTTRMAIVAVTVTLIALIGLSRVYVGVHYPTDVLAGWVGGIPWLYACIMLHEHLARRHDSAGEPVFDHLPALIDAK